MIFFSHKIKFKKQSQSLGLNLNDKGIKNSKAKRQQLIKKHQQIDSQLKINRQQFQKQKNNLINKHNFLLQQQKKHKMKLLKLQVRRDQLKAKQNQQIYHIKANILKKYLKSIAYTIGDKYQIMKSCGGQTVYYFLKTKILHLQSKIHAKTKMKDVVYMKLLKFQQQKIMFMIIQKIHNNEINHKYSKNQIRIKTNHTITNRSKFQKISDSVEQPYRSFQIIIYTVIGNALQFKKNYSQNQFEKFVQKLSHQKKTTDWSANSMTKAQTSKLLNKRHRLSLQFNTVFKKSFEGFFSRRLSQENQNNLKKIVAFQENLKTKQNKKTNSLVNQLSKKSMKQKKSTDQKSADIIAQHANQHQSSNQQQANERSNKSQITDRDDQQSKKTKSQSKNKSGNDQSSYNQSQSNQISNFDSGRSKTPTSTHGLIRSFIFGQKKLFPDHNPLFNIVILKKKKQFFFLYEYLENQQNFKKIQFCVKKYQLKIKLQKNLRKFLLYKVIKIDRFFQTINGILQPLTLQLLFYVKYSKDDIYIPKSQKVKEALKQGKTVKLCPQIKKRDPNLNYHQSIQLKGFNGQDIVISCENIRSQKQQNMFLIHQVLKQEALNIIAQKTYNVTNNNKNINHRGRSRIQPINSQQNKKKNKQLIQQQIQQKIQQKMQQKKINRKKMSKINQQQVAKAIKIQQTQKVDFKIQVQKLFAEFMEENILSVKLYKFLKIINFQENIDKIIIIQKYLKMFYYKKLYKNIPKNQKIVKYQPSSNILVSSFLDTQKHQIKIYVQCIILKIHSKQKPCPLMYNQKYWFTISNSLNSLNKISSSVIEMKDQLQKYMSKKIKAYQAQQQKLQALKPELYLNRLRRFFINVILRVKVKKNIFFIKKVTHNSQTYVLIIRKSLLVSNVCKANLYHLDDLNQKIQIKQQQSQKQISQNYIEKSQKNITKNKKNKSKTHYQTINLLTNYFHSIPKQKIIHEFYFDNKYFLLKPPKNSSIYYIQRLLAIDINSQQILKQTKIMHLQQNSRKMRNQLFSGNDLIIGTQKQNQFIDSSKKIRKRMASIKLNEKQSQKQIMEIVSKKLIEKQNFRITMRNNTINSMKKKSINPNKMLQQKKNMQNRISAQRLSRNSLLQFINDPNLKIQFVIKGNGHGKMLYYSLLKNQDIFYQLHLYIVKRKYVKNNQNKTNFLYHDLYKNGNSTYRLLNFNQKQQNQFNQFNDELILVHKQSFSKSQLVQANWTYIYQKIAKWVIDNQDLLEEVQIIQKKKIQI